MRDKSAAELYLDLLKKCLTRLVFEEPYAAVHPRSAAQAKVVAVLQLVLARRRLEIVRRQPRGSGRLTGRDWPAQAETMIGVRRLENIQACVVDVLDRNIPGDLIETGVWRGGSTIFMRGILRAYGDTSRVVWVADSFRGLPKATGKYPADVEAIDFSSFPQLAVPLAEVRANFERYDLLDEQVRFIEGYFHETLPAAPIERLAVARLDGDLYESTIVALESLYPKLSPGGYLIVDDYGAIEACRRAVDDYRGRHAIAEPIVQIDQSGVYWRRAE